MTPEELRDLREWAAGVMGWKLNTPDFEDEWDHSSYTNPQNPRWYLPKDEWHPDIDKNQAFQVVERMRELGYEGNLQWVDELGYWGEFDGPTRGYTNWNQDPALAILLAARATGVK
jgi:hypothetical protein